MNQINPNEIHQTNFGVVFPYQISSKWEMKSVNRPLHYVFSFYTKFKEHTETLE